MVVASDRVIEPFGARQRRGTGTRPQALAAYECDRLELTVRWPRCFGSGRTRRKCLLPLAKRGMTADHAEADARGKRTSRRPRWPRARCIAHLQVLVPVPAASDPAIRFGASASLRWKTTRACGPASALVGLTAVADPGPRPRGDRNPGRRGRARAARGIVPCACAGPRSGVGSRSGAERRGRAASSKATYATRPR